jgi:hypothetical protein
MSWMIVGMRVRIYSESVTCLKGHEALTTYHRIVEYATREQAQQAVAQLSNQNLMGRLVYVREVSASGSKSDIVTNLFKDRESEPRFIGATGGNRGGFSGGMPGGFNNQGGYGGPPPGAGGRQIYVANVCSA